MRTPKLNLLAATSLAVFTTAGNALAFDPEKVFKPDEQPRSILSYGFEALKSGRNADALGAFKYGAEKNHVPAEWKLARMFQTGEGVKRDHLAAFKLFSKIADRFYEHMPNRYDLPYVSHAVVSLGHYSQYGIKGTPVVANPRRAENYYMRAAAAYHDAEAQYRLGKLYLDGLLGANRQRNAARWFSAATKKGHALAQAELGRMLFYGEGVKRNRVRGLVHLTRAKARAARKGLNSVIEMEAAAYAEADNEQRSAAARIVARLNAQARRTLGPPVGLAVPAERTTVSD